MGLTASRAPATLAPPSIYPRAFRLPTSLSHDQATALKANKQKLLSVMQYNLLADRLCTIKRYPFAKEHVRQFEWRGPMIVEEIKQANCDVVCL